MSREAVTAMLSWVVLGAGLQERGSPEAGVWVSQSRRGGESARLGHVSRVPGSQSCDRQGPWSLGVFTPQALSLAVAAGAGRGLTGHKSARVATFKIIVRIKL